MNAHTPLFADPADASEDWAQTLLRRQLDVLGELAETGLEITRAIKRQVTSADAAPDGAPAVQGDPVLAYTRVARAVRLTLLLQSKLIDDLRRLEAGLAATRQTERRRREAARKHRLEQALDREIDAEADHEETLERLAEETIERLEDEDLYDQIRDRPFHEIAAEICRDLGLDPSLGRVTDSPGPAMWVQGRPPAARGAIPIRPEDHKDHPEEPSGLHDRPP